MEDLDLNYLEDREKPPASVEELSSLMSDLGDREYEVFETKKNNGQYFKDISETRNEFVQNLLLEKDRFDKIFKTSSGSIYFQIKTGETLRAKMMPDKHEFAEGEGEHFKFQPILNNLFFVLASEVEKATKGDLYPGEKLKTTTYELGACPLELNIHGYGSQIVFEEKDGFLYLIGTALVRGAGEKIIETDHNLVGGYHVGHPITEIIK